MNKTDRKIFRATSEILYKYRDQLETDIYAHMLWMLKEILFGFNDTRKINRWLGFIHGQLVALTDCTIDELRDLIR